MVVSINANANHNYQCLYIYIIYIFFTFCSNTRPRAVIKRVITTILQTVQFFLPIAHPRSLGWTKEKRHSGWQFINRLAQSETVFLQSNEEMWKAGKLNPSWMVTGGNEPNKTMSAAAPWRMSTTIPLTPEWKYDQKIAPKKHDFPTIHPEERMNHLWELHLSGPSTKGQ